MAGNQMTVQCPQCNTRLVSPPGTSTTLRCSKCKTVFARPAPSLAVSPPVAVAPPTRSNNAAAVAAGVCVLVAIGLIMSFQSVSLMSGSGIIWTGVALVGGGVALAFFLRGPTWVKIVAVLVLGLVLFNACSIEQQMDNKRKQISNTLRY